jgi:hypothetical protein
MPFLMFGANVIRALVQQAFAALHAFYFLARPIGLYFAGRIKKSFKAGSQKSSESLAGISSRGQLNLENRVLEISLKDGILPRAPREITDLFVNSILHSSTSKRRRRRRRFFRIQ